jgi:hypothetical protein
VHKNWRVIGQILNGANLLSAETTDQADQNRVRDYVLAYELMWGERASGLTAFAYNGKQDDLAAIATPDIVTVKRFGVTASHVFKRGFEVQGGYVKGTDDYDVTFGGVDSVDGKGLWLELEQYFSKAKDLTIFGRYDSVDPNEDVDDDSRTQIVVGLAWPVADWHARWAVELRKVTQQTAAFGDQDDRQAVGELMLNF